MFNRKVLFAALASACLVSCGKGAQPTPLVPADSAVNIEEAIASLSDMPAPPNADAVIWVQLRDELAAVLARQGQGGRHAASAPTGDSAAVQLSLDAAGQTLSWYLVNPGDYNQDGRVAVSDLSPVGIHFGEVAPNSDAQPVFDLLAGLLAGPFEFADVLSVVDGDENGQIRVADVTPIGLNFGRRIEGYRVYASNDSEDYPNSSSAPSLIEPVADLPLASATGDASMQRLAFSFALPQLQQGLSYWVRPYGGGVEGTPSSIAGAPLEFPAGALRLIGIQPASAEPGTPVQLVFNQDLPADLEGLTVRLDADTEVPLGWLAVSGKLAGTVAPISPAGQLVFEAFNGSLSLGTATLTINAANPTLTLAACQAALDEATLHVGLLFESIVPESMARSGADEATAMVELAELDQALEGMARVVTNAFEAASEEERQAALGYLENSGYMQLLASMAPLPPKETGKSSSAVNNTNWNALSLDVWSAAATNSELAVDALGIYFSTMTLGTGAAVALFAKLFIVVVDNIIDTFFPTDLFEMRRRFTAGGSRDLTTGPPGTECIIEGKFCSESSVAEGTISLFVETYFQNKSMNETIRQELTQAVQSALQDELAELTTKSFFNALLPKVADPEDACFGHVGPYWFTIDTLLYEESGWLALADRVIIPTYDSWSASYVPNSAPRNVTFDPPAAHFHVSRFTPDRVEFDSIGRYIMSFRALTFHDSTNFLFWRFQTVSEIVLKEPFWVGTFGDWKTDILQEHESNLSSYLAKAEALLVEGRPVILYNDGHDFDANPQVHPSLYCLALGEGGEWERTLVAAAPAALLRPAVLVNGEVAALYATESAYYWLFGTPGAWTSQPVSDASGMPDVALFDSAGLPGYLRRVPIAVGEDPAGLYAVTPTDPGLSDWDLSYVGVDWLPWNWQAQLVGGNPAFMTVLQGPAYPEYPNGAVMFTRATTPDGKDWAAPQLVTDLSPALKDWVEIGGVPAACFVTSYIEDDPANPPGPDSLNPLSVEELYYSPATGVEGAAWAPPVKVSRARPTLGYSSFGDDCMLAEINGLPALCYERGGYGLSYRMGKPGSPVTWGVEEVVQSGPDWSRLFEVGTGPMVLHLSRKFISGEGFLDVFCASTPETPPPVLD
jgi:hypothetical protein